jgi:hypothetical protein
MFTCRDLKLNNTILDHCNHCCHAPAFKLLHHAMLWYVALLFSIAGT